MKPMKEPVWVPRLVIKAVHIDQIREHGGIPGMRDEALLEAAIARPRHKWTYKRKPDLAALAAAYCFGIVRNHPFRDGNKRVGFLAAVVFLGLNGYEFTATEEEVVTVILELAAGKRAESNLAKWFRDHIVEEGA